MKRKLSISAIVTVAVMSLSACIVLYKEEAFIGREPAELSVDSGQRLADTRIGQWPSERVYQLGDVRIVLRAPVFVHQDTFLILGPLPVPLPRPETLDEDAPFAIEVGFILDSGTREVSFDADNFGLRIDNSEELLVLASVSSISHEEDNFFVNRYAGARPTCGAALADDPVVITSSGGAQTGCQVFLRLDYDIERIGDVSRFRLGPVFVSAGSTEYAISQVEYQRDRVTRIAD